MTANGGKSLANPLGPPGSPQRAQGGAPSVENGVGVDPIALVTSFLIRTLAGYLAAAGQFDAALRLLEWSERRWPRRADIWALRGQILLRWSGGARAGRAMRHLLEGAADAYRHAEELRPDLLEVRRERGLALLRLAWLGAHADAHPPPDLLQAAIAEYDEVLRGHQRRADVLHERAMARAGLRAALPPQEGVALLEQALADLDASIALRPHAGEAIFHRAELHAELARLFHRLGRWSDERRMRLACAADHAHVRQLRPDWLLPLMLEAVEHTALARLGDNPGERLRQAIDAASTVLAREPRNAQATLVRAEARLEAARRFGDADDERAPMVWKQAEADYESAMTLVGLRNREEVQAVFAQAQATWAGVLAQTGRHPEARQLWTQALEGLERAVDDDPRDLTRLLARADVRLRLAAMDPEGAGELCAQALGDIGAVLELDAGAASALALRAEARLLAGMEAPPILADIEHARQLAPEDGRILAAERRILLGLARRQTGDARAFLLRGVLQNSEFALQLRADDARAHLDQARALQLAGRAQAAYAALEQALRLAPGLRHEVRQDAIWADVAQGAGFRRLVGAD